jgi:hypothetical protein
MVEPLKTTASKAIWYQGEVMQEDQKSMLKYYQHLSPIENSLIMLPCRLFVQLLNFMAVKDLPSQSNYATERIPVNSIPAIYRYGTTIELGGMGNIHPKRRKKWNTSGSNSSKNGFIMIQK